MKLGKNIIYWIMLCIIVTIFGCYSTSIEKYNPQGLPAMDSSSYRILYLHLKDSSIVDVLNQDARYVKKLDSVYNVIVFHTEKGEAKFVKLTDIKQVVLEKTSFHAGQTIVAVVAVLGALVAALGLLLMASFKSMH